MVDIRQPKITSYSQYSTELNTLEPQPVIPLTQDHTLVYKDKRNENPFNAGRPKLHHYKKSDGTRRLKTTSSSRPVVILNQSVDERSPYLYNQHTQSTGQLSDSKQRPHTTEPVYDSTQQRRPSIKK